VGVELWNYSEELLKYFLIYLFASGCTDTLTKIGEEQTLGLSALLHENKALVNI